VVRFRDINESAWRMEVCREANMISIRLPLLFLGWVCLPATLFCAEGLPVKSQLVRDACGACHRVDAEQHMSRISYMRKTPEGWEETVQRMVRLHKVSLTPSDAREIVRYLSDSQGLTASELEKVSYALEQRDEPEQVPNEAAKKACSTCHSYAKVALQRRTKEEWFKLKDFLLAMYPTLVYQHRQIDWPAVADEALAYFAQQFPLETPEWQREKDQPPPGDGTWLVVGSERGRGDYVGQVSLKTGADGSREVQTTVEYADRSKATVHGQGRFFACCSWRGSMEWQDGRKVREVFHLSADGNTLKGRWYLHDHPEIGGEEVRYRIDTQPRIAAVFPRAVRRGVKNAEITLYGSNFQGLKTESVNLGEGVKIEKINSSADRATVQISVAPDARIGLRDVRFGTATGKDLFTVYDTVDYIRVFPEQAMARVGGERVPKKLTQFEARAFSKGSPGAKNTVSDLDLGPVRVTWRLNEAASSIDDNDIKYVGSIDANGLFTPAVEGPNPERVRSTNNAGDVWVEASYTPVAGDKPALTARAYLIVTIPRYRQSLIP
jgi:quinohemoprotein amine dehydrogenase